MSGPWERFASGPWQRFGPPAQDRSDALAASIAQGATMNFGDEITAAVRATAPEFSDWMMRGPALQRDESIGGTPEPRETSKAATWRERYEEELSKTRGQFKANKEAYPVMTTAGEIGGAIGSAAVALPAAATAAAPTVLGNVAKMGLTGGLLGAASGFGEGEGQDDRLSKALLSGGTGAATGAALPVLGVGARWIAESAPGRAVSERVVSPTARAIANLLEGKAPPRSLSAAAPDGTPGVTGPMHEFANRTGNVAQSSAMDRIATALQRGKLEPQAVERRLGQLGDEAMLADVDPQLLSVARMAHTMPGETRSHAKTVLEARDRQAGNRIVSSFEGGEPPPSSFALRGEGQAFDQNLRAVGSRAYGLMDDAGLKQSPDLMKLYENPIIDKAINKVMSEEAATRAGTSRSPASPVDIMHKVKQEIADMGVAATGRGSSTQSYFRDLAGEYVRALKAANPALADADRSYAQAASLPEFFDAGRSFLGRGSSEKATANSAPALADLLTRADPQQGLAARAGATNAARETALEGTRPARALAQRIDQSAPVRDKLVQLYGPQQADRIMKRAAAEGVFADTSNEILRGSKTTDKIAEIADFGNTQLRASPQGVTARAMEKVGDILGNLGAPNEAVRNEMGRLTLTPDQKRNQELLQAIAAILAKRQQGAGFSAGAAGASGNLLMSP